MTQSLIMNDNLPTKEPRKFTGRDFLLCMIAFFAVIFAVNFYMMSVALKTFAGVDADNAYKTGLAFEQEVRAADRQDARGWKVNASVSTDAGGKSLLDVRPLDKDGKALANLTPVFSLAHPTDRRYDRVLQAKEIEPGRYESAFAVEAGQWDVVVEFAKDGERVFRSRNRVVLKGAPRG